METSNYRRQQQNDTIQYTADCQHHFDASGKTNFSRRSIDWRDSGIVIDEDNHLFQSFDGLCNFETKSSIQSECNQSLQSTSATTSSSGCPSQKIAYDQDDDGDTILHLAVVGFTVERVKDLMKLCDLNAINNMMQTPMHVAVLANRPEMVELLVASGAKLDVHDRRGNTPVHLASQRGFVEIVDIIFGAIWTRQQQQQQQQHSDNNELSVKELVETCNFDGLTCLHLAAINDKRNIINQLVGKYQANLNARDSKSGETIMHKAIRQFNVELVNFILNLNNDNSHCNSHCNHADYSGREPLSTIKMLQDAQSTSEWQLEALVKIKVLVEMGVEKCVSLGGCCFAKQIATRSMDLTDDDDDDSSTSSSSDYSDLSDCDEMT